MTLTPCTSPPIFRKRIISYDLEIQVFKPLAFVITIEIYQLTKFFHSRKTYFMHYAEADIFLWCITDFFIWKLWNAHKTYEKLKKIPHFNDNVQFCFSSKNPNSKLFFVKIKKTWPVKIRNSHKKVAKPPLISLITSYF